MDCYFREPVKHELIQGHLKMGGVNAAGEKIGANSLFFTRDGVPWIGTMGEYHFCRDERENWRTELLKMKAGGISVVSTYVFWIYHEEDEGVFDFSGNRDIRRFLLCAREAGLEICLRPGPWVNAECRNGGFPDWLTRKDCKRRSNDPAYLRLVERYWKRLYEEVRDIPLLMIQIENELVDDADHIAELKRMAQAIGFSASLWTATGWNSAGGAKLPLDEVIPMFGGYPEAPWENHREKLPPSSHFFFQRMRNDAAIGADLMVHSGDDGWHLPYERYPFATCEMGGGVQIGLIRRPIIRPMDVYALALVELGSGNNWLGTYMYHGGTNAIGRHTPLNAAYCPVRSYDFQAPVSEYGEIREHYRLLNLLHLFVTDFGELLAPMEMAESEHRVTREDTESLRCCLRTDGEGGFVFVNHYQRLDSLADIRDAVIHTKKVIFPKLDIGGEICFFLPFGIRLGEAFLEYATVQPVCREGSTWFFTEIPGIRPEYRFAGEMPRTTEAGKSSVFETGGQRIVTLTWRQALGLRRIDGRLYLCETEDLFGEHGRLHAASGKPSFSFDMWETDRFVTHQSANEDAEEISTEPRVTFEPCEPPFEPPEVFSQYLEQGGSGKISWFRVCADRPEGFAEIRDAFDVGQLYADGTLAADQFYCGRSWRIPAKMIYGHECRLALSPPKDYYYREYDPEKPEM
ncbi:MAG: beta-galactosidase [Clostridia bacterium]|nr:beta-galactosidase [Clostridia bacterium]